MTCTYWNIKSRLSLMVRVNVVLNRTVLVNSDWRFDNLCGSHLQSQSELYQVSWWYYTLVIDLIGQLHRDVIGCLSVKPWCYWLWRLIISNWRDTTHFDSEDDYRTGCQSISHCPQQQSYSGLFTRTIKLNLLLKLPPGSNLSHIEISSKFTLAWVYIHF